MRIIRASRRALAIAAAAVVVAAGAAFAAPALTNGMPAAPASQCAMPAKKTRAAQTAWQKCRFDEINARLDGLAGPPVTVTETVTETVTATPTGTPPTTTTRPPTSTTTASPTSTATPTGTATTTQPAAAWPDASNTGVAGCPPLAKVNNSDQVVLNEDGQVYQNVELLNEAIIRVRADNTTIRCVKMNGTGWFGIDTTEIRTNKNTTIDKVDISCQDKGQVIGILAHNATITQFNIHNCDHAVNAGGDNLTIKDSYCHALTDLEVVHADCVQTLGGNTNMRIEHNSFWSRDTSDVLLGQEFGEAKDVVIHNNRFMSEGEPPPAYLLYLSGTNTKVTDNRFTRRYSFGHCTDNTKPGAQTVWSGNVWDDDGSPVPSCGYRPPKK